MILGLSVNANAQQPVDVDGYNYVITSDKTVSVAQGGARYIEDVITVPATVKINNIEYTVTGVNQNAFSGSLYGSTNCSASKIILPNTVTTLQKWAFSVNPDLKTVILSDNIKEIPNQCFQVCEALSEIHLPANLETFGSEVFNKCASLQKIEFPSTLKSLGTWSFQNCGFINIEVPEGITVIPQGSFPYNKNLEKVVLPSTLKSIEIYAFILDNKLNTVTVKSMTPPTVDKSAFFYSGVPASQQLNLKNVTLYVPEGSIDAYKAADVWKDFGNIKAIDSGVEDLVADDFDVEISGLSLTFKGYEGIYQVYTVDGRMVYSGSKSSVTLPAKGIYIVRTGKKSFKVAL